MDKKKWSLLIRQGKAQLDDGPIEHQPRQFSHVRAATRKEVVDLDENKFQETFTLYTHSMLVYTISSKSL